MKDQNRLRLERITARYERRQRAREDAARRAEREAAFHAEVLQVFAGVLRPLIEEIGAELGRAGHAHRVEEIAPAGGESPRLDLYLLVRGRSGSKDLIQFVVRSDAERGPELIAELVLKGSPVELSRFRAPRELTGEVAEQLLVDAVEHVFASPAT